MQLFCARVSVSVLVGGLEIGMYYSSVSTIIEHCIEQSRFRLPFECIIHFGTPLGQRGFSKCSSFLTCLFCASRSRGGSFRAASLSAPLPTASCSSVRSYPNVYLSHISAPDPSPRFLGSNLSRKHSAHARTNL